MPKREKLPDELKELCSLCRTGKLFAMQQWIRDGRPYCMPPGNFATSPIRTAIESGFHSLVEVLLQEGAIDQEEKNEALVRAMIIATSTLLSCSHNMALILAPSISIRSFGRGIHRSCAGLSPTDSILNAIVIPSHAPFVTSTGSFSGFT